MTVTGRAWVFGDNVNTDVMAPGLYFKSPMSVMAQHCMEAIDPAFAARSLSNFLWVTFTRSNPSHDVHGVGSFVRAKHWGCEGPLIIDARIKPHHAPPLIEDPEVTRRVDDLAIRREHVPEVVRRPREDGRARRHEPQTHREGDEHGVPGARVVARPERVPDPDRARDRAIHA